MILRTGTGSLHTALDEGRRRGYKAEILFQLGRYEGNTINIRISVLTRGFGDDIKMLVLSSNSTLSDYQRDPSLRALFRDLPSPTLTHEKVDQLSAVGI